MDPGEGSFDIIDFGSASSDGTPLIKPGNQSNSYTASPMQPHIIPIDRLRKFEEFIDDSGNGGAKTEPKYWSLEYFQPYFDVTTEVVLQRLTKALKPWSSSSSDFFSDSLPDLYAPFWISTTLIVALTVSGNAANYLSLSTFTVNLSLLVSCASLVYTVMAAVPVGAYCLLKHAGSEVKMVSLIAIYGYSYLSFVPAVVVAGLEVGWMQWPIMLTAAVWSFQLLRQNYQIEVEVHMPSRKYLILGLLVSAYILFILTVNLSFLAIEPDAQAQKPMKDNR